MMESTTDFFAPPLPALPTQPLPEVEWAQALLDFAPIKALLPVPVLLALAPLMWRVAHPTWRHIDKEAAEERARHGDTLDLRPAVCLVVAAIVLTMQEYYGGRAFFEQAIKPELTAWSDKGHSWVKVAKYGELYGYSWWVMARILGYVVFPLTVWKLAFPQDRLMDMGLRGRGFFKHLWIYGACLAFVLPVMLLVAQQPDFGTYYPFYKLSSRSWFDFLAWEAMYWLQFLGLELFFRGWMLAALRRSMGSAAIFVMAVPYCMIHYGKPYLEAHGAIVAGVVLGTLAMRTRSIYAGFLLHITVAAGMDWLSLFKRAALPQVFWAGG
jgi:membrane protease YdiL (CAAX protease family)